MTNGVSPKDAWYTCDGPDSDVCLSSRLRLARNLGGFVFPAVLKSDEAERIQSLVFDAFNHLDEVDLYQMIRLSGIDGPGRKILAERGLLETGAGSEPWKAVILREDGVLSATVNIEDHLRIAAYQPGLSLKTVFDLATALEGKMQERLHFASLAGFGYLASSLSNTGSGMKISALLNLPALEMTGLIERVIREFLSQQYIIRGYYGAGRDSAQSQVASLGALYHISNASAGVGTIESQLAFMEQGAAKLVELERKAREDLWVRRKTEVEDAVFRAIVTAKYARFISLTEGVSLLGSLRLGLYLGLVTGVLHRDLTALLYRIQTAHIGFVISSTGIIIEEDITSEEMKLDRLRAMVIQEVLKTADIHERR